MANITQPLEAYRDLSFYEDFIQALEVSKDLSSGGLQEDEKEPTLLEGNRSFSAKPRTNMAATRVFNSADSLLSSASGPSTAQEQANRLVAMLQVPATGSKLNNRGASSQSDLRAPSLKTVSLQQKTSSPLEELRSKASSSQAASKWEQAAQTIVCNDLLREMTEIQATAAVLRAVNEPLAKAIAWSAETVCHSHPSVTAACKATQTALVNGAHYAVQHIPQPIQQFASRLEAQKDQTIERQARQYESLCRIPSDVTRKYHHNLEEMAAEIVLAPAISWGVGHVASGAAKAFQKASRTVVKKVENSRMVRQLTQKASDSTDIAPYLPTYRADSLDFVQRVQESHFRPFQIKKLNELMEDFDQGGSGSKVFGGVRSDGSIPVFVKTLPIAQLAQELVAHETFKSLQIPGVYLPKITALGKQIDARGHAEAIFSMKAARGEKLSTLLQEVGRASGNKEALRTLQKGVDHLGEFLAALHNRSLKFTSHPSPEYLSYDIQRFRLVYQIAKETPSFKLHLSEEELETLIRAFERNPGKGGFSHGDVHPDNFFIDSNKLYLIDLNRSTQSIGTKGVPIGVSVKDVEQASVALEAMGRSLGVKPRELEALRGTFATRYFIDFKGLHTQEASNFYRMYWSLRTAITFAVEENGKAIAQEFLDQFHAQWVEMFCRG